MVGEEGSHIYPQGARRAREKRKELKKKEKAQTNNDMNDKKKHSVESVGEDGGRGITRLSGRWRFEIFRIWREKIRRRFPIRTTLHFSFFLG